MRILVKSSSYIGSGKTELMLRTIVVGNITLPLA